MHDTDTIAAIATAPGRGGIGIVRLSGPQAQSIAEQLCRRKLQPRYASFCQFFADLETQEPLDHGLALLFSGPRSFTGEDVIELQGHGAPIVLDRLVQAACNLGARPARPGEFSERAFLNGKLDLVQAEAIADLIAADSERAARNAMRSLEGAFSKEIEALQVLLTELRIYVEAAIDFPDEEIEWLADGQVMQALQGLQGHLQQVQAEAERGLVIQNGLHVVLTGAPNAGKSSLLNALAGYEAAIVTEIPGTTRDVVQQTLAIEGVPLRLSDTAGIRDTEDPIEQEGIRRAQRALADADVVLHIVDARNAENTTALSAAAAPNTITVLNKCDLLDLPSMSSRDETSGNVTIRLSAKTGEGIGLLRQALLDQAGLSSGESRFSARRRHLDAIADTADFIAQAASNLHNQAPTELIAEDLRLAQQALAEITGGVSPDALLGKIFGSFCIGK